MLKKLLLKILVPIIFATLLTAYTSPSFSQSDTEDLEFFNIGINLTYSGLCIKAMGMSDDAVSERESQQFAQILAERFGAYKLLSLEPIAVIGLQQFEADHGANCQQMLKAAKSMINSYGIRTSLIDRALAAVGERKPKDNIHDKNFSPSNQHLPKLTEELHEHFLNDDQNYELADAMLNDTWRLARQNLDKDKFSLLQKQQRKWVKEERYASASSYAKNFPAVKAYTRAIEDRIKTIANLINQAPLIGEYENADSMFSVIKNDNDFIISGNASTETGNTCMFEGRIISHGQGLQKVENNDYPPFFVLFTSKGAAIQYAGSGEDLGCGMGVNFKGIYKKVNLPLR